MSELELVNVKLDAEDRALLVACSKREKLTMSDVLRRALRAYAAALGVKAPRRKRVSQ